MLPYLAQGANSSLEDGAVLGRLLGSVTSPDEIAPTLQLYEKVRKTRGEGIAKEAVNQVRSRLSSHLRRHRVVVDLHEHRGLHFTSRMDPYRSKGIESF